LCLFVKSKATIQGKKISKLESIECRFLLVFGVSWKNHCQSLSIAVRDMLEQILYSAATFNIPSARQ
jgi:hypothetical protein